MRDRITKGFAGGSRMEILWRCCCEWYLVIDNADGCCGQFMAVMIVNAIVNG